MFDNKKYNLLSIALCAMIMYIAGMAQCRISESPELTYPPKITADSVCVILPVDEDRTIETDIPPSPEKSRLNIILLDNIDTTEQAQVIGCINKNVDRANAVFNDQYGIERFYLNEYVVQTVDDNHSVEDLMVRKEGLDNLSRLFYNDVINIVVTHNSEQDMQRYDIQNVTLGFVFGINDSHLIGGDDAYVNTEWLFNVMVISMDAMRDPSTFVHEIGHMLGLDHCCNDEWRNKSCNYMLPFSVPCADSFTPEQVERMTEVVAIRNTFDE